MATPLSADLSQKAPQGRAASLAESKDWTHENEVDFVYPSDIDEGWVRRRVDETMRAFSARRHALPAPSHMES